ncbi:hypothetical protein Y1Q_0021119 [Alligator mississippiensis]|uniref:Uncharacterized protein n=1 Tax=Alligator mississippiensis TaxID=8496 RepID=A0A151NRJ5_ALLMI|nr:hypothetical protein Y1Q_0021119 [Alligator mississippiensis]
MWMAWQMEDNSRQDRWQVENITHKDAWDKADWEFWVQLLVLETQHMKSLHQQASFMDRPVEAMKKDCWVLDIILALAVTFMPPAALPSAIALLGP